MLSLSQHLPHIHNNALVGGVFNPETNPVEGFAPRQPAAQASYLHHPRHPELASGSKRGCYDDMFKCTQRAQGTQRFWKVYNYLTVANWMAAIPKLNET
jgi:hypothetical protein